MIIQKVDYALKTQLII